MKSYIAITIVLFAGCSSTLSDSTRPVAEPAAAARFPDTPTTSLEFGASDTSTRTVDVVAEAPVLLNGEVLAAGGRKTVAVPDLPTFEVLIDDQPWHLPAGTMTLTVQEAGWEVEGPAYFAYPPDSCDPVREGASSSTHGSSLIVNFGISCGAQPDLGKFAVTGPCGEGVEAFHHGSFSGGSVFALRQYGRTEMFVLPPGDAWEVGYSNDRQRFAVR